MPDNNEPFGIRTKTKSKFKKNTKKAKEELKKNKAKLKKGTLKNE